MPDAGVHKETVGLSPKAPSAAVAALAAPLVARLIAELLGIEVDNETVEGLILAGIAGLGGLLGAYLAKPGNVQTVKDTDPRAPRVEA